VTDGHHTASREALAKAIRGGSASRWFDSNFDRNVPNWPPECFVGNDRTCSIPSKFLLPELAAKQANIEILPVLG
jgi:hypothetical protein